MKNWHVLVAFTIIAICVETVIVSLTGMIVFDDHATTLDWVIMGCLSTAATTAILLVWSSTFTGLKREGLTKNF